MTATYKVDVNDELSLAVFQSIKEIFKGKIVDITVTESIDETEYLLHSDNNRRSIETSLKEIEEGKGIFFTVEELKQRYDTK